MITRVSRKLEIQFNFRKFPDQPYILSWLSVSVPAKDKEFGQKGNFSLTAGDGKVWDEPTVRRLEELSVKSDTLRQAWEECERSPPAPVHPMEERERWLSGKDPGAKAMLERYFTGSDDAQNLKWLKQCGDANRAYTEALAELASLAAEMSNDDIVPAMLNQVIPLESGTADERAYVLYRSAVWCTDRDLTPEQWRVLIDRFLEREDAELAVALSPLVLGESTRERIPTPLPIRRRNPAKPPNRQGRRATGLYPDASRSKIAELVGRHVTTITHYFNGRTKMPLEVAVKLAPILGVSVERLTGDLSKAQAAFAAEQNGKYKTKKKRSK